MAFLPLSKSSSQSTQGKKAHIVPKRNLGGTIHKRWPKRVRETELRLQLKIGR